MASPDPPASPGPDQAPVLLLVRPGRTALNASGRLRGRLDPPLDAVGESGVGRLAHRLAPYLADGSAHRILSSPLLRATRTGHAIAERTGLTVEPDDRLLDRDYGPGAGELLQTVLQRWASLDAAPGVEPRDSVAARARSILHEAIDEPPSVLVSHDAVLHAMLEDLDPSLATVSLDPAGWTAIAQAAGGTLTIISINSE